MDTPSNNYIILKGLVFILVISFTWANVVSSIFYSDNYAYELCDPIDGESEKEDTKEETKEETEKDEKVQIDSYNFRYPSSFISARSLHSKTFQSYHHLEIYTPPPESIF